MQMEMFWLTDRCFWEDKNGKSTKHSMATIPLYLRSPFPLSIERLQVDARINSHFKNEVWWTNSVLFISLLFSLRQKFLDSKSPVQVFAIVGYFVFRLSRFWTITTKPKKFTGFIRTVYQFIQSKIDLIVSWILELFLLI